MVAAEPSPASSEADMASQTALPTAALDFLLFLGRAEGVAAGNGAFWEALDEEEQDDDMDAEICRAKVQAFEANLRAHLDRWKGLPNDSVEMYRARIEDLLPALEETLERRRRSKEAALHPELQEAASSLALSEDSFAATAPAAAGAAVPEVLADAAVRSTCGLAVGTTVKGTAGANDGPTSLAAGGSSKADTPWFRKKGAAASRGGADLKGTLGKLEEEMANMSEDMKGVVSSFRVTLKKDDEKLQSIAQTQDRNHANLQAETAKGKKLLWSSSMGFLCTMILLVINLVIFFMMIPFIIFT